MHISIAFFEVNVMKKRSAQYLVVSLTSVVATVVVLTAGNLLTGIGNRVRINGSVYSSAEVRELINEARDAPFTF